MTCCALTRDGFAGFAYVIVKPVTVVHVKQRLHVWVRRSDEQQQYNGGTEKRAIG